jgi:hypothetical protein
MTAAVRHDSVTPVALVPRLDRGIEPENVTPALAPESTADGCRIKSGMTTTFRHDSVTPALAPESTANGCRIRSGMTAALRHDGSGQA